MDADEGEGGVKNQPKSDDVVYGRPQVILILTKPWQINRGEEIYFLKYQQRKENIIHITASISLCMVHLSTLLRLTKNPGAIEAPHGHLIAESHE